MTVGAIDCDIHPGVPDIKALLPYMNDFWQESFVARGHRRVRHDVLPAERADHLPPGLAGQGPAPGASWTRCAARRWTRSASAPRSAIR